MLKKNVFFSIDEINECKYHTRLFHLTHFPALREHEPTNKNSYENFQHCGNVTIKVDVFKRKAQRGIVQYSSVRLLQKPRQHLLLLPNDHCGRLFLFVFLLKCNEHFISEATCNSATGKSSAEKPITARFLVPTRKTWRLKNLRWRNINVGSLRGAFADDCINADAEEGFGKYLRVCKTI